MKQSGARRRSGIRRPRPALRHERSLREAGCQRIAGLDEAGRGALAGPVVAAAVILPIQRPDLARALRGVKDSKQLSSRQREDCAGLIRQVALDSAIGLASAQEVDALGLLPATRLAMNRALSALSQEPDHLLIDHLRLTDNPLPQTSVTRGDALVLSIAAASVLAKVARDRMLDSLEQSYPGYGLARHKGYGTPQHLEALLQLGPSAIHRSSCAPVAAARSHGKPGKVQGLHVA